MKKSLYAMVFMLLCIIGIGVGSVRTNNELKEAQETINAYETQIEELQVEIEEFTKIIDLQREEIDSLKESKKSTAEEMNNAVETIKFYEDLVFKYADDSTYWHDKYQDLHAEKHEKFEREMVLNYYSTEFTKDSIDNIFEYYMHEIFYNNATIHELDIMVAIAEDYYYSSIELLEEGRIESAISMAYEYMEVSKENLIEICSLDKGVEEHGCLYENIHDVYDWINITEDNGLGDIDMVSKIDMCLK